MHKQITYGYGILIITIFTISRYNFCNAKKRQTSFYDLQVFVYTDSHFGVVCTVNISIVKHTYAKIFESIKYVFIIVSSLLLTANSC